VCEFVDCVPFGSGDTANILPLHWLSDDLEDSTDEENTEIPIDNNAVHRRV